MYDGRQKSEEKGQFRVCLINLISSINCVWMCKYACMIKMEPLSRLYRFNPQVNRSNVVSISSCHYPHSSTSITFIKLMMLFTCSRELKESSVLHCV